MKTAMQFTKKPVTIYAAHFDGTRDSAEALIKWMGSGRYHQSEVVNSQRFPPSLDIVTLEDGHDGRAKHVASVGDWIIQGVQGEFYACKPDIFEATYSAALAATEPDTDLLLSNSVDGQESKNLTDKSEPGTEQSPDPLRYAKELATAIWQKHYATEAPQWKVLPDLYGALSQIDNMTTGLTRKADTEQSAPTGTVITLRQAMALVNFFGGNDCEVTVVEKPLDWGEEFPKGLYAYCTECPDEGTEYLGPTDVCDDTHPAPRQSADQVRDAALEEAAVACETQFDKSTSMRLVSKGFAELVRTLKSSPAPAATESAEGEPQ